VRFWNVARSRLRSVFLRSDRESDLREELQFHLDREAERLQSGGMRAEAARRQAARSFGAVEPTKEECRDARGTAVVDGIVRDVRYAWRSFLRAPLAALTIVATVGLGLGLVAVVFTILNAYIFRPDAVRQPDELFAVERQRPGDSERTGFSRTEYDALLRDTDLFSEACATTADVSTWIDGVRREGRLVTGNFFQVLGASAARGRALTPQDDRPGGVNAIVLSHRAWTQHFAGDPGILERTVLLNGARFQVVGIMPEDFRGLEPVAAPDFWAPLALLGEFRRTDQERAQAGALHVVGRLKPAIAQAQAVAQLRVWESQQPAAAATSEQPRPTLVFEPRPGTVPLSADTMLAFMPLFFAFGLILVIGCANVANLLLARAVARQREIGIRLAIGASRRRIVWQLLTENLLLALVSAVLAFGISRLVLTVAVYVVVSTFPPDIGNLRLAVPPADWRVGVFLVLGAIVSTIFFALAPALQATRLELVRAVRGEVVRDARPGRARNALVVLQVTGSVLLLICAGIFLRSSWAAATVDPGIRTTGVLSVRVLNEQRRGAVLDMLRNEPVIASLAAAWPGSMGGLGSLPALADVGGTRSAVTYQFVSPEYFGVFDIPLVRGRGFLPTERSVNDAVAIVSEKTARELWPGADPLGQAVRIEPDIAAFNRVEGGSAIARTNNPLLVPRSAVVVGIARDVAGIRLGGMRVGAGGIYLPIAPEAASATLTTAVRGDSERARHAVVNRLATLDPNAAEIETLQTLANAEVYLLGIPFWLTLVLGGLALMLTLSGLFSVLSYLVEQRTREIGVRMALGATRRKIAMLVLSQSARPVAVGMIVGAALTSAVGALLLATPAAETIGSTVRLFDPLAYAGSLLCTIVACALAALVPSLRASRIEPVVALRQD
jgi:predicted permease